MDGSERPVLVCYASLAGSTAEVAEAVADTLRSTGLSVEVRRAREVRTADIERYSAVVLGSAIRMGKVLKETLDFVRRNQAALAAVPTAYFTVGLAARGDTPERLEEARGYLRPLEEFKEPVAIGLFAGKMDHQKVSAPLRLFLTRAKGPEAEHLREGDWRDWETIRSWAQELGSRLRSES